MAKSITVTLVGVNHSALSSAVTKIIPIATIKDIGPDTDGIGNCIITVDEGEDTPTKTLNVSESQATVASKMNTETITGDQEIDGNLIVEEDVTVGGNVTASGNIISNGKQALSGSGALTAVNITDPTTTIVTSGAATTTLADGVEGQEKFILMLTDGGDCVLTPANLRAANTITFNDAGDNVTLKFIGTEWSVVSNVGCTVA